MRERLAIARARSNYATVACEAFADNLGVLLLRALDNHDGDALHRAKWILGRNLSRRSRIVITRALGIVHEMLRYLHDQRCPGCAGRQFIRQESSVRACLRCSGTGLIRSAPMVWSKPHYAALHEAQAAMGKALATARTASDP